MTPEKINQILVPVLSALVGVMSVSLYLSVKRIQNMEETIQLANEARVSWRDEAYRLGYKGSMNDAYNLEDTAKWVAGENPVQLDHGPYKFKNQGDTGFGLFYSFNQSTGEIDSIYFKGKRIYPANDTIFIKVQAPTSKYKLDSGVSVDQDWRHYSCDERILATYGWYKGCIVYNEWVTESTKPGHKAIAVLGYAVDNITPQIVYAEQEKAAAFLVNYTRKKKGEKCEEK